MRNSAFPTRITSLYESQPSSEVFACERTPLRPELEVCMGPSPHLGYCAFETANLKPELQVFIGLRPCLWSCECKTACYVPE